jgi:hypothetical protein
MRLTRSMLLTSALGALGALLLAADMYRRLLGAERTVLDAAAGGSSPGVGSTLVFGMVHVLGVTGVGLLFLALCLMLIAEKAGATDAVAEAVSRAESGKIESVETLTPINPEPIPTAVEISAIEPIARGSGLKFPMPPPKYPPVVPVEPTAAWPEATPVDENDAHKTMRLSQAFLIPDATSETEFNRSVAGQLADNIPVATPIPSEAEVAEAALTDDPPPEQNK